MTTAILSTPNDDDDYVDVDVQAQVISSKVARHKASFFLAMNVGHLLRADNPKLLLDEDSLQWQLDVVLTSPRDIAPQFIRHIHLAAADGTILAANELVEDLTALANAHTLA